MRNLKRALSLALASVMLLGMMVVGAGAAYTDEASIANVEAAEVVSAIGIMAGKTGGKMDPTGSTSRAEIAQMFKNFVSSDAYR